MKLIIGIDPGTTTAIAMINLSGDFYQVFSKKGLTLSKICEHIAEKGEPIIIATDVAKPPLLTKKIAAAFNAVLFKPKKNISQSKKRSIIKAISTKLSKNMKNKHEKDALAAAINARKAFLNTFEKIDSILKKKQLPHINEDVKSLLIKHKVCNINQAIKLTGEQA